LQTELMASGTKGKKGGERRKKKKKAGAVETDPGLPFAIDDSNSTQQGSCEKKERGEGKGGKEEGHILRRYVAIGQQSRCVRFDCRFLERRERKKEEERKGPSRPSSNEGVR